MRKNYYKKQSKGILDGSLTEKISDRNVPWPKCTVTEMFCDRNVLWPKCSLTEKFRDRNVPWPKRSVTEMFCDRKVLWPKCSLTEKIHDRNVLWPKSSDWNVPLPKCFWPKCETGQKTPLCKGLTYVTRHAQAQGCAWGIQILYGTLKYP